MYVFMAELETKELTELNNHLYSRENYILDMYVRIQRGSMHIQLPDAVCIWRCIQLTHNISKRTR